MPVREYRVVDPKLRERRKRAIDAIRCVQVGVSAAAVASGVLTMKTRNEVGGHKIGDQIVASARNSTLLLNQAMSSLRSAMIHAENIDITVLVREEIHVR